VNGCDSHLARQTAKCGPTLVLFCLRRAVTCSMGEYYGSTESHPTKIESEVKLSEKIMKINDLRELHDLSPRRARRHPKSKRSGTDARIGTCVVFTHQPTSYSAFRLFPSSFNFPPTAKCQRTGTEAPLISKLTYLCGIASIKITVTFFEASDQLHYRRGGIGRAFKETLGN
jgi:hypothetical protein